MKTLPFRLLTSNELYAIANRIAEACKLTVSDNEYLMKLCAFILEANNDLRKGLGRTFNSEFTSSLLLADEKRDGSFIGLRDYIHACCNSGDDLKDEAARSLSLIVEAVGNTIYALPFAAETTKLDVLFEKFDGPAAREALATIAATDWLERVKARQADFEKVYQSKIETEAGVDIPLVKSSKEAITNYLKGLFAYIATNVNDDATQNRALEEKIDGIITDALTIARSRATRIENAEKDTAKATE
ncbi:MAG TPA: DUF6261 family protein [Prolixibacteraceae bacterium]|nr:DUF6261 family protein [Prolixibacteraceae bacterium]